LDLCSAQLGWESAEFWLSDVQEGSHAFPGHSLIAVLKGLLYGARDEMDFPEDANVKPPRGISAIPLGAKKS